MTNGERNPSTLRDQSGREIQPERTSETTPSGTHAEYRQPVTDEGNGGSSTPEISADIERTRRKMGQRIDQIQAKLDPDRLIDEAQTAVRDIMSDTASSITDYVRDNRDSITSSVTNAARRNPLPTALIGLGVGWLLLESLSGDSGSSRPRRRSDRRQDQEYINRRQLAYGEIYSDPYGDAHNYDDDLDAASTGIYGGRANDSAYRERSRYQAQESGSGPLSKVKDTMSHVAETVKGQVENITDQVKGQVENVKDQVEGVAQNVQHQAGDIGHRAQRAPEDQWSATGNRAQEMGGSMRRMTRRRGRQLHSSLEDNPLTYGALALAAGAVMAYLLPQTKMENQAIGQYRDQIVDEADEMMHEASARVKEVVNEVRPELEQSAKAIGQELSQSVKQAGERVKEEINPVVEKAKEAAKDEARQAAADRGMGQGSQSHPAQGQGSQGQNQPLSAADRNKLQGQWRELRGSVKQKWGKLTDDELTQIEGSYEKLSGALQRHYGHSQTQAEREIDEYLRQRK